MRYPNNMTAKGFRRPFIVLACFLTAAELAVWFINGKISGLRAVDALPYHIIVAAFLLPLTVYSFVKWICYNGKKYYPVFKARIENVDCGYRWAAALVFYTEDDGRRIPHRTRRMFSTHPASPYNVQNFLGRDVVIGWTGKEYVVLDLAI